jgi:hypothetical protein
MDDSDWELLDKQLRRLSPSPHRNGYMLLIVAAAFVTGMAIGLFEYQREPMRLALNDSIPAAISVPY